MAIIALLVAILVPALSRAREVTQRVVCASNLHQISVALVTYSNDNDGKLIAYRPDGSDCPSPGWSTDISWTGSLYGGNESGGTWGDQTRSEIPGRRKLNPYTSGSWEVYRCPSDKGMVKSPGRGTMYGWSGSSYLYNSNWYGATPSSSSVIYRWVLFGRRYQDFAKPSRQIMIADHDLYYTWPYWSWEPEGLHGSEFLWHDPPAKHQNSPSSDGVWFYAPQCNVGFLDGHVTFMRLGPYEPYDYNINTATYTVDPEYIVP